MPPNIRVCVNGFVLSTLLFDCANNSGDQEGFLYGSVTRNVRREINDQSMSGTQEDILISICSSVPCGTVFSFYNNNAQLNKEDLEFHLGERKKNIVGWYRYRRYSAMYPSVRESVVHENLKSLFGPELQMGSQYFIYAVFSSSNLPNFATHSYDYAFFTQRSNCSFRNINTTILNLGDTRNSYRSGSMALPFMDSSSFNSVLSTSWNFNSFFEIEDQIQHFHQKLRLKLESLQEELAASDAVNAALDEDIRHLSNDLQTLLATQEQLSSAAGHSSAGTRDLDQSELGTKQSSGVKRVAVEPVGLTQSNKRQCRDKYFESEEYEDVSTDEIITDSSDAVTSAVSFSTNVNSDSQATVVDLYNGESNQNKAEISVKSDSCTVEIKDTNIPSPSSTVEVVISDTGLQTFFINTEDSAYRAEFALICLTAVLFYGLLGNMECKQIIRESDISEDARSCSSAEPSDIKESSSDQVSSPKEVDTSNLIQMNVTTDPELQSETVSSAVNDAGDNSVCGEGSVALPSSSGIKRASCSSDKLPQKMIPPFIIYASKESKDQSKDPTPSSSTEKCQELDETKLNVSPECKSASPSDDIDQGVLGSPTASSGDQVDEDESDPGKKD